MTRLPAFLFLLVLISSAAAAESGMFFEYTVRDALSEDAPDHPSKDPDLILQQAFYAKVRGDAKSAFKYFRDYFATGKESAYARAEFSRFLSGIPGKEALILALEEAEKAIRLDPDNQDNWILKTELLRKAGKSDLAEKNIYEYFRKNPESTEAEFYLAESLHDQKKYREALLHYRRVLFYVSRTGSRRSFYRSSALWRLSHILLMRKRPDLAEPFLRDYVRLNPERLYPRYMLAVNVYLAQKDIDAAEPHLEHLVQQNVSTLKNEGIEPAVIFSAYAQILFLKDSPLAGRWITESLKYNSGSQLLNGLWYTYIGRPVPALRALIPYLRSNPGYIPALAAVVRSMELLGETVPGAIEKEYLKMSQAALQQGMNRLGIQYAVRLLEHTEGNQIQDDSVTIDQIYYQLSMHHLALKHYARSLAYIRMAAGLKPDPGYEMQLVNVLMAINTEDSRSEAYSILVSLLSRIQDDGSLHNAKGNLELMDMQTEKALASLNESLRLNEKLISSYYLRAALYWIKGKENEEYSDLRKILAIAPDDNRALNAVGYRYAEKGEKITEALEMLTRAAEAEPFDPHYADSLGWAYYKSGDKVQALLWLDYAKRLMESSNRKIPEILEHLAAVKISLDKTETALQYISRALELIEETGISEFEKEKNRRTKERLLQLREAALKERK